MSLHFAPAFRSFWLDRFPTDPTPDGRWLVGVTDTLPDDRSLQTITVHDGRRLAALTPARAAAAGLATGDRLDDDALRAAVTATGLTFNGADLIFGLGESVAAPQVATATTVGVRRLGAGEADAFAAFVATCSPEEVDEAYVEIDHWVAFGAFDGDAIVAASSAYPWGDGAAVADIGVITAPTHRGRGLGRAVVRAAAAHILDEGLCPLYRCQATNLASAATGRGAGFSLFGTWDVAV